MFKIAFIVLVMTFCTMGIYFFVKEITSLLAKNNIKTKVFIEISNSSKNVESELRSVLNANPECEIIVDDKSNNPEICSILKKLCQSNSNIILNDETDF